MKTFVNKGFGMDRLYSLARCDTVLPAELPVPGSGEERESGGELSSWTRQMDLCSLFYYLQY